MSARGEPGQSPRRRRHARLAVVEEGEPVQQRRRGRGRFSSGFATLRDAIAFGAGLLVIGHEVFVSPEAEPAAVAVGVALTGLPLALASDERKGPER